VGVLTISSQIGSPVIFLGDEFTLDGLGAEGARSSVFFLRILYSTVFNFPFVPLTRCQNLTDGREVLRCSAWNGNSNSKGNSNSNSKSVVMIDAHIWIQFSDSKFVGVEMRSSDRQLKIQLFNTISCNNIEIRSTIFSDGVATSSQLTKTGGCLRTTDTSFRISDSVFQRCSAEEGGAIYSAGADVVDISSTRFISNFAGE